LIFLKFNFKYDAEFRRFGLNRQSMSKFEEFYQLVERLHGLNGIQFIICYTDKDGDLLPINNDNNLARVLNVTPGLLRLIIQRKGECYPLSSYQQDHNSTSTSYFNNNNYSSSNGGHNTSYRASNIINQIKNLKDLSTSLNHHHSNHSNNNKSPFFISYPEDFRPVSAIIDVDILPDTFRRVRLHKHKSSKPLGFYIRDGRSLRVTPQGVEQVPGIFISRLMPGGLAESTGLLSVNDEVIEVNGIEVHGKTLDQVTDMMVANSSNLIITVKPTNQRYNLNRSTNNSHNSTTMSLNTSKQLSSSSSFKKFNINNNGTSVRNSIKNIKSNNIASNLNTTTTPTTTTVMQQPAQTTNESITSSRSSSSFSSSNKPANIIKNNSNNNNKTVESDSDDDDDDEEILDQHHDNSNSFNNNNNKQANDLITSTNSIGVIINNSNTNHNTRSSTENSPNNNHINELNNSSSDHDNSDDKILTL
jgi:partitioning defective protein 6